MKKYPLLWQPAVLLLLVLLALIAAYRVRPSVPIKLGDYEDSIYLHDFHAREVDSAGSGREQAWPASATSLELPGERQGIWIATVFAADTQPDDVLRGLAMSANGQRLTIARQGARFLVGVVPADVAAAERLVLQLEPGLREGPEPPAGLAGRVVFEPARTYRWSSGESRVVLPDVGQGAWSIDMHVVVAHPDNQPVHAQVFANETLLATLPDNPALRRIRLLVPASTMSSGSLELTLRATTYDDPRPLGILLSDMVVSPVQSGEGVLAAPILPPWGALLSSLAAAVAVYICLAVLTTPVIALGCTAALLGVEAWALIVYRFPTTFMLPGLALLAVWSVVLLFVLRRLLSWWMRDEQTGVVPHQFINLLLLIFFVGYWIKAGGMLYPYFVGIDVRWHMDRVRWILNGDLPLLYGTSSPLNESTMPVAEWGNEKPVIPYSPFYHIVAAGFVIFPWSLETSASMVSALLDCGRVLLIALLAYRCGLSRRAALLAALLYAILPVTFLLHSWGNVPTTSGLWWDFAATVFMVVAWDTLRRPGRFVSLVLLLVAALLFYTVAGFFLGLFLIVFTLAVLWVSRARSPGLAAGLVPLWLAVSAALLLVMLIYYYQYIGPILERTIPYFIRSLSSSAEEMGKAGDPLSVYLVRHTRLWDYGFLIPLAAAAVWVIERGYAIWRAPANSFSRSSLLLWAATAGWMGVTGVFLVLAYKVSMVDKHFFVTIPLMVIATAALIDRLWERYRAVPVVVILWYAYLGASALNLWIIRIITVKQ